MDAAEEMETGAAGVGVGGRRRRRRGVLAASIALVGVGLVPTPSGMVIVRESMSASAATEDLSPAQRLAERKRMMQARVDKVKSRATSKAPGGGAATPPVGESKAPEGGADQADKTPDESDKSVQVAPADTPPPAPSDSEPVSTPESKLDRSKFEAPSPGEVAAERRRLLQEKIEKDKMAGSGVAPS